MCLYPRLVKNPKYTMNKKNGGNIPPVKDQRVKYVPIGCGNCVECMKKKTREWKIRLTEDIKDNTNGKFITLTFSDEQYAQLANESNLNGYLLDNWIATTAVRRFLERYRKQYKTSVRHWLITELGHNGTENIHLHGIIWTDNIENVVKHWQYGYVWRGNIKNGKIHNYVNEATVNYITKYVTKVDIKHKQYKPVILTSPGIGRNYKNSYNFKISKFNNGETREYYITRQGHKIALPIYYRNKLYTEEERENLWLQKLDKEERYIMGHKVKPEHFIESLKHYQEINTQLGYGNDEKDWNRELYERETRIIKQQTRIQRAYNNNKKKKGNNEPEARNND